SEEAQVMVGISAALRERLRKIGFTKEKVVEGSIAEHNKAVRRALQAEREYDEAIDWMQRGQYQAQLDQAWSEQQADLEAEARGSCHVGPGDPDYRRR